jgi:superfamily II DNA or RNA helicase
MSTNKNNFKNDYRYYQKEADDAIFAELETNKKCIVKMFCGTGKSLLMRKCKVIQNKNLVAFVFPSLSLIDQFYDDYLKKSGHPTKCMLKVSSDNGATVDPIHIHKFLKQKGNKIVCVTYQSYQTFIDCLGPTKIDVCLFDEAHHAVGETYQKLIFENDVCEKQIFFTATPKNANGIIMYDKDEPANGMCGNLVYDYSYLRGINEDYLNSFEIRIDMFTENTTISWFESIARAILVSENNRVLTFHSDVNTERDKSVIKFVNEPEFIRCFNNVLNNEFPEKRGKYKKITMIEFTAKINVDDRKEKLELFDATPDDDIFIISSCETIGEGIDTKRANMCVFIDPKTSFVKIIQNIGRIVRKPSPEIPQATILLLCWVDKNKYLDCRDDKDKRDEIIRQDLNKDGNFNGILNVMSALKQEDEDIYDLCLHYPHMYSHKEIETHLGKHGVEMLEPVGNGTFLENVGFLLDDEELNYDDYDFDTDEELILQVAEDNDVCIEIHTNSLENPVEKYNSDCDSGEIIRMYKTTNDDDEEYGEPVYCPIVKKCGKKKDRSSIPNPPNKKKRPNLTVHTNPEMKVLWNIVNNFDITKEICSGVIDCEVVDREDLWEIKLQEADAYITEHNKKPPRNDKNKGIQTLSNWVNVQKTNYKNNKYIMQNNSIRKKWEQFVEKHKIHFMTNEEEWNIKLHQVDSYITQHNKRPSTSDKDTQTLGSWLSTQQKTYKKNEQIMMNEDIRKKWECFVKTHQKHFMTDEEEWNLKLQEADNYITQHNKRPSNRPTTTQEIQTLARWIQHQLNNYKNNKFNMKNKCIRNKWEIFVETHKRHFMTDEEKWNINLQEADKYITQHNKRPSDEDTNKVIRCLGKWLGHQQTNYKNKDQIMQNESIRKKWEDFIEKHQKHFITNEEYWNLKLQEADNYITQHNTRPNATNTSKEIQTLANWVNTQQGNYKKKIEIMINEFIRKKWEDFIEKHKSHFMTDEEEWNINLQKSENYITQHNKRPSTHDKNKEIKFLGSWISRQTNQYKSKEIILQNEIITNKWKQFVDKHNIHFMSNEEKWDIKLQELELYIKQHNKRPSTSDKNKNIKTLANWVNTQKTKYKQRLEIMKNADVRKKWEDFIEKHKTHFVDDNDDDPDQDSEQEEEEEDVPSSQTPSSSQSQPHPHPIQMKDMDLPAPQLRTIRVKVSKEEHRKMILGEMSQLHKKYKTMTSQNLNAHFEQTPDLWKRYHKISEENEKTFPTEKIPRNRVIAELNKISGTRIRTVVDMGCGTGKISEHYKNDSRFKFLNYDHISANDNVNPCDISTLPLKNDSVDICILSLAMWGSNCHDYVREAHRVLESNGQLYIIEATKRWSDKDENENMVQGQEGGKLRKLLEDSGFQVTSSNIAKFCLFVGNKKVE